MSVKKETEFSLWKTINLRDLVYKLFYSDEQRRNVVIENITQLEKGKITPWIFNKVIQKLNH